MFKTAFQFQGQV